MSIFGPICILTAYLLWVSHCRRRLEQLGVGFDRRWYFSWIARGLVAPILLWVLLNVGHSPFMPAIVKVIPRRNVAPPPTIIFLAGAAPNAPPIIVPSPPKYVGVGPVGYVAFQTAPALAAIGSYWGAAPLGWFVVALA